MSWYKKNIYGKSSFQSTAFFSSWFFSFFPGIPLQQYEKRQHTLHIYGLLSI